MRLTTVADAEAIAVQAADELARLIAAALAEREVAHVALAGGSTPRRAYELLGAKLDDWSAVHLWFGDERCVGPEDPDSNYRLVRESLMGDGPAARATIHRVPGELGPEPAASAYEEEINTIVTERGEGNWPLFDVQLLGIGEDGHTASLFPGHPEVLVDDAVCVAVRDAPKPPPDRVSLTLPVINDSHQLVLLASGAGKRDALTAMLAGPDPRVPSSLLRRERLHVIADDAAHPPAGGDLSP